MQARILSLLALLLFAVTAMAQSPEPYATSWKKADSLLDRGLPESARKIVDKVYADAQRTNQTVQMVKAQLYFLRIDGSNREDADSLNIARAEEQARKTSFPVNAVWQSIAAQLYWNYYQQHRYEILERTTIAEKVGDDFEQWDASKFVAKVSSLYLQSIARGEALKAINIAQYDPVLVKGKHTRNLRPTLFDLLAFRAINFFENDEKDLTKPAFQFVMDDAAAFAPAESEGERSRDAGSQAFITHRFKTQDTTSMQYRALTLYQEILRLHEQDASATLSTGASPDAFIDADLQRLQFAYAHSVHPDKKALYRAALEGIEKAYPNNPLSATASFRIAELMMQVTDAPTDEGDDEEDSQPGLKPKADLRAVKAKLDAIIAKYPESEGGVSARQLLQSITAPSLSITAEEAVLPDAPSRILVTYKNVPKAWFRVVKMNPDDYREAAHRTHEAYIKPLFTAKALQTFSSPLPGTDDYTQHRAEVKVDALPLGMYAVIISAKESFAKEDNAMSFAVFQVTRLAVVTQPARRKGVAAGYVLDRKEGTPIARASVAFFTERWNGSKYELKASAPVSTGVDGAFPAPASGDRSYNGLLVKSSNDAFYSGDYLDFNRYSQESQAQTRTFLFTDRSIYRPGQTIFFKAIVVNTDKSGLNNNVAAGTQIPVTFYDANGQTIATQRLITNEWGSFTGNFTAPNSGLLGAMRIGAMNGDAYISVEEYKRPKFRVDWDTIKSDYSLNGPVVITGHAAAYAGNNVDGATVKYRVVRNVRWPYWWYSWRFGYAQHGRFGGGRSAEQQMGEGTATTDADGKFTIRFTALPDRSIDERSLPVFTYTVYADVTDLNGETRSGEKSIAAGYRSLQIVADIPEQASRKDLDTVRITTQNLNGDFVAASVDIKVARLAQPDVIYRKRYWPVPDQFTMSEAEFRKNFPLDAYKDEDDYRTWKEAEIMYERRITTTTSGQVTLPTTAFFNNGWYCITLSAKDRNGKAIEEKKFVQVWDFWQEAGKPYSALLVKPGNQTLTPGEDAEVVAITGLSGIHVIQQVHEMSGKISASQNSITAETTMIWLKNPIVEADRGGIALSYITVKDNRVYTASASIDVPWTNKDLSIEWETHRDKLLPGQQETWTMVVRGNKKDKVAAEVAAALYDASLDAFKPHSWGIDRLFASLNADLNWNTGIGFGQSEGRWISYFTEKPLPSYEKLYDDIVGFGPYFLYAGPRHMYMADSIVLESAVVGRAATYNVAPPAPTLKFTPRVLKEDKEVASGDEIDKFSSGIPGRYGDATGGLVKQEPNIPIRKNLQETAFFYPQLRTDADGAVRIQFTIPEALTEWKLLAFAHTKDMRTGLTTGTVKTQKDLMVQPGLPRFLRQGDEVSISTKIVNLSDAALSGTATLEIIDALTGKPLNNAFSAGLKMQGNFIYLSDFKAPKGGSTNASWTIHIPESRYEPVIIRIRAKAGAFSDGEENTLPVLTNRMLVTETLPLWMNGAGTKTFSFGKLKASDSSKTLAQHRLTLEYTANPAWYAVQALPYLMEYPYECAEQTFNRYYANALAAHILEKAPKVKAVFKKWEEDATLSSFKSPLEKNEELKSALLEETPWVLDAQSESEQRKNIARLFQTARMARELDKSAKKLEDMMLPEGGTTATLSAGWPWFKGDTRPDRYITQYIVTGIGRLQKLGVTNERIAALAKRAVPYLDRKMEEDYRSLLRYKADLKTQHISYFEAQYLYMRSFFAGSVPGAVAPGISAEAQAFYKKQAQQYWPSFNPYVKGMIAIALYRGGDKQTSATIIQSLKETSIQKEELGMYWMDRGRSWWWWEAPIEAQSLLIECFAEVAKDQGSVDKMKRWLLKQKQTQNWPTTKATADACYALLLQGTQWLENSPEISIELGDKTVRSIDRKVEAGSGYFKVAYSSGEIKPSMGTITVTQFKAVAPAPSWGAVYWQYFENLDKITSAATPLVVKKALFIEKNSDRGPVLEAIKDGAGLKIGDKVKARIEIIVDRDMEYVHLKDGRAACFEPTAVLSGYRWQGGLGYYESTKDASSNFFFSYLPKGKYVFEYPMFVTNAGEYSAGLATIQCMYAPEFSAHSAGLKVSVR